MNRTELYKERRSTIETDFNIINDKLDDISSRLEELSKHLYEIAKCDNHEYSKMFGENDIIIDIRRYIKNDFVRDMLPNKSLVIKSDDILDMLK